MEPVKKKVYIIHRFDLNAECLKEVLQDVGYNAFSETRQPADCHTEQPPSADEKQFNTNTIVSDIIAQKPDVILCEDSISHEPQVLSGRKIIHALRAKGVNTPAVMLYSGEINQSTAPAPRNTSFVDQIDFGSTKKILDAIEKAVAPKARTQE